VYFCVGLSYGGFRTNVVGKEAGVCVVCASHVACDLAE
jgi:anaerobic glycerol-3-phosphate dehydrogenase